MNNQVYNKIFIDFDSTIIAGESLDWLAAKRGVGPTVEKMTSLAMNGQVDMQDIFVKKNNLIAPRPSDMKEIIKKCQENFVPGIEKLIFVLQNLEKDVWVLSANFHEIIDSVVSHLNIPARQVIANNIYFEKEQY